VTSDAELMQLALRLAEFGEGGVNPNPLVGAVVAADGEIVGRGYHRRFGGPHAEVIALDEAGPRARGATLAVTLEPCAHHGKTPPCSDRVIESGVARVIVACRDPNPLVNGQGIRALRAAGIEVVEGVLGDDARRQNEIFFAFTTRGRPFVLLKLAISLDGRIATRTGDARWITSEAARRESHRLRRKCAAVLVGIGTAIADDPQLTVRHVSGRDPVPIVLDSRGRIPPASRLLDPVRRPIIATASMSASNERALAERGARVWRLPGTSGRVDLPALLDRLAAEAIDSVLVEGGSETAAAFLEENLVDKVQFHIAPLLIGGREAVPAIGGRGADRVADALRLSDVRVEALGDDLIYTAYPPRPLEPGLDGGTSATAR